MTTFEVEELHVVLGAIEKRVPRLYVFKNLPGTNEDDVDPTLTILDRDNKLIKDFMGDDLLRIKNLGDKNIKLTFQSDRRHGAVSKLMGRRPVHTRTVYFPEEDADLVASFIIACRKLSPAAEIEYAQGGDGMSDIESKSSVDGFPRDSTNGRRSPIGSFDMAVDSLQTGSPPEGTLIEHLGGNGAFGEQGTSGLLKVDASHPEFEEETVTNVRAPPMSAPALTLVETQIYSEFMREFSTEPKYFCRVRNRYGMFEGKLMALVGDDLRLVSLVEQIVQEEVVPQAAGRKDSQANNEEHDDGDSSANLAQPSSTSVTTASTNVDGNAVVKQETATFWSIPRSRITKFVLYGLIGSLAIIVLDDGVEIDLIFENAGARKLFKRSIFGEKDPRVVQLYPGGEECGVQDLQRGWTDFAVVSLKGMGNVRTSRMMIMSRTERCFWIFRNTDLLAGLVCESCEPFRSIGVPSTGISIEPGKNSKTRLKFGLSHTSTIANAPSSSSLVPSVKSDGSEKTHFDLLFPNYFERERFIHHLHALASTLKITAPPSQRRAKVQRQAWHRPSLDWFEVKRSLFVGTFNVGDSSPPDHATLDLWVGRPAKAKRDMITGGLKTQARVRAKSGSAGVTGRFSMYVLGLQECGNKFDEWTKALQSHFGSEFCLVSSARLWEMGILVFATLAEASKISCVETSSVATGRGIAKEVTGMQLGNKGGVAIGLRWHDTSICFVNAHLAPHQEKVLIRNQNFSQIMAKLGLHGAAGDCGELGFEPTHSFEHVFFFGDMNYRVDESFQKVISIASQGKWPVLWSLDQLRKEMESQRCYFNFREAGTPNFPPTYRWERGKRAFSNKRDQPPSYTDRILIHSRPGLESKVSTTLYGSSQDIMTSDHRPVAATFTITLREPYTPWPLHPLTAEVSQKERADDSTPASASPADVILSGGLANIAQELEREASTDSARLSKRLDGDIVGVDPLYPIKSESPTDDADALAKLREEELRDEDEEDDPDQFLGHLGSFYVTPESFSKELQATPPEIRLSNVVLKLERREGTDKLPPTFVQLRIASRILQEVGLLETAPGFEDLSKPNEFAFVLEQQAKEGKDKDKPKWGSLHYVWNNSIAAQQQQPDASGNSSAKEFTTLKPTLWDPCYLASQHLSVAVEEISSSRKKEEARKKISTLDVEGDEVVGGPPGDSPISGRKTLSGDSNGRTSARLSRRKRSVGTAAMQIGSAIVGAAATAVSGSVAFAGQVSVPLREVIEKARAQVTKDAGMANWSRSQPISLEFTEPVVFSGIRVGELKGVISLVPGGSDERKLHSSIKTRAQALSRVAGRHLEPLFCQQSFDVEVQLEGFNDKKGNLWRQAFAALDTNGLLYIAPKPPGGNKTGQAFIDALLRSSLLVLDVTESRLDYSVGAASAADRPHTFEILAKKVASSAHDTYANNPRATVIFSVSDESERKMWGTCVQAIELHKRAEREFIREQVSDRDARKDQRARRLEIERKRRYDAEQVLLNPKPAPARVVTFDENPQAESTENFNTPAKTSFLARAGTLLSLKKSTATKEDFGSSFRSKWLFGTKSMQDVLERDDENEDEVAPHRHARSAGRSHGETVEEAVPVDLDKDLDDVLQRDDAGSKAQSKSNRSSGAEANSKSNRSSGAEAHSKSNRSSGAEVGGPSTTDGVEGGEDAKMTLAQRLKERAKHSKLRMKKHHSARSTGS